MAFGASAITHPVVVFVIPSIWRRLYQLVQMRVAGFELSDTAYSVSYGVLAESFAVLAEAGWLFWRTDLGKRRVLLLSMVANVASSSAGGLVYLLTGWP
ncbi:MAG: hypothetical protein WKG00_34850 [Polyangiaceae bacterium]